MGSHATCSGAWVSGPEDIAPDEYFWGYNRMMTIDGLFGAGDAVGGSAHKFSSGSFTEGRLASKAAVKYIQDKKADNIEVSDAQLEKLKEEIFKPIENYTVGRNEILEELFLQAIFYLYKDYKDYKKLWTNIVVD